MLTKKEAEILRDLLSKAVKSDFTEIVKNPESGAILNSCLTLANRHRRALIRE